MTKQRIVAVSALSVMGALVLSSLAVAGEEAGGTLCAIKRDDVQTQLEYAREHHNSHRVRGLERALAAIEENCTDEGLLREAQEEVDEHRAEVEERQADLDEALAEQDDEEIREREAKLDEATRELDASIEALNALERLAAEGQAPEE